MCVPGSPGSAFQVGDTTAVIRRPVLVVAVVALDTPVDPVPALPNRRRSLPIAGVGRPLAGLLVDRFVPRIETVGRRAHVETGEIPSQHRSECGHRELRVDGIAVGHPVTCPVLKETAETGSARDRTLTTVGRTGGSALPRTVFVRGSTTSSTDVDSVPTVRIEVVASDPSIRCVGTLTPTAGARAIESYAHS